ncbi:histidine kinase [Hoeflea ulvae]|uniref:Histidine kinase n=1 Tax=Hoeflea ulvae TaxID=2983764 RepID=A0ABT3Y9G2_9HYPH|nr:histidine kinase [Hoeflea ulvae]MCY0092510.1 histidine kinase [Hoeflea ulvae]
MPSLFRFLFLCAVLVGIVYGAMFALVMYVEPVDREVTVRVPTDKLND